MLEFSHGGGVEAFAKEIDCNVSEVIDLSSNINFIKPKIKTNFNKLDISAYPTYDKLYKNIAKNYRVKSSELELFNGGSSAIFTLFRDFDTKSCAIYSPAYLEYKKAAKLFGYELQLINRLGNIYQEVKQNSLVIFVNPSTPDGKQYDIKRFMKYWKKQNATVLIDESFLDFANKNSAIRYLKKYDKLYILKSMTKFYSSAGIRVGVIISTKKNIKSLKAKEPAWKISEFDKSYLLEALKDNNFKSKAKRKNKKNKKMLKTILANSNLFGKIFPSSANFILAKLKSGTAKQLQEKLKPHKIMIRDCQNFDFLDDRYIRVAVKSKKDLAQLKKAIC